MRLEDKFNELVHSLDNFGNTLIGVLAAKGVVT